MWVQHVRKRRADRALLRSRRSPTIGCWAVTEPDHGSDTLAVTEPHFSDPSLRANCVARKDGDDYVIRGQKAAWVSNGTIADVAALFCTIDPSQGFKGGGVCLVPLDLPGVSRGKPLDKLGQRALNQGEIFFDDVRVPASYMVVGAGRLRDRARDGARAWPTRRWARLFVGVARAALEHALAYAKERVQGGVPIFEHQSVQGAAVQDVHAGRGGARAGAPRGALQRHAARRWCSTRSPRRSSARRPPSRWRARRCRSSAATGSRREYPIEKLLRDARASMIEDGCNEVLSLVGAAQALIAQPQDGGVAMELREVIGRRRSIRFLLPLQAGRAREDPAHARGGAASRRTGATCSSLRAVVVFRDSAPQEVLDALPAPIAGYQIRLAPGGDRLVPRHRRGATSRPTACASCVDAGALGFGEGKQRGAREAADPDLRRASATTLKQPGLGEVDCGQGIAQATLMAFEQGLGTCCLGTPQRRRRSARTSACPRAAACCCCRPSATRPRARRPAASGRASRSRSSST